MRVKVRRNCCRHREKEDVELMGGGLSAWEGAGQQQTTGPVPRVLVGQRQQAVGANGK